MKKMICITAAAVLAMGMMTGCSGEKKQDGFRAALERLGISPAQQHEILHLSADSPRVLEAALKEIERSNGRIRSPLCFLRSRLMSVRTA